jgi:hypothetical protein
MLLGLSLCCGLLLFLKRSHPSLAGSGRRFFMNVLHAMMEALIDKFWLTLPTALFKYSEAKIHKGTNIKQYVDTVELEKDNRENDFTMRHARG